ncbi:MAG: cell division protein FtsQ/DivIB [Rickettsiales bacterium]|jgi:hypothetical protein|nr:cell division protein FtsQ/DivIB [Rickettsiales bacterium]
MRTGLPLLIYAAASGAILLYAAARFVVGGAPPTRVVVYSDTGRIGGDVRRFLSKNAKTPAKIPSGLLERFPGIGNVSVRNNLNGAVEVRIKYKRVAGVWESGGSFYPLLENGEHIGAAFPERPARGIVFRGALPAGVGEIVRILSGEPELVRHIRYLEYVEGRRWNIILNGGALVMLPERDVGDAVRRIRGAGVLGKTFATMDLRVAGRALVK